MKANDFLKKYGAEALVAACKNEFDAPDEMTENQHLLIELTDDQTAVISTVVDGNGKHVAYVDEYLPLDNFDLDAPCMKLNGQLWEPCPRCGREPVYLSLGGYCEKCGNRETETGQYQCPEPYRRGIGQGFGNTEDG